MIGVQDVDVFQKVADRFDIMHLQNVGKLIEDTVSLSSHVRAKIAPLTPDNIRSTSRNPNTKAASASNPPSTTN